MEGKYMQISELQDDKGLYNGIEVKVKPFNSFIEKQLLCLNVLENCMDVDENGMLVCNYFTRKLVKDINIVKQYSDIELSDSDYISEYDFLVQNEIFEYILDRINDSELCFIDEMIDCELEQRIKTYNSLEKIVSNKLQQIIDKLPSPKDLQKLSKSLVKDVNKLNWDKMPMLKQMWETANFKQGDGVGK